MMEDGVLHINFQKASLAETWPAVLKGHANLNSAEQEQETQKILLERFQREVSRDETRRDEQRCGLLLRLLVTGLGSGPALARSGSTADRTGLGSLGADHGDDTRRRCALT